MTLSNSIFFAYVGAMTMFAILTLFLISPILHDLKFLLENMDCTEILKNSFEFESWVPKSLYEQGKCFK